MVTLPPPLGVEEKRLIDALLIANEDQQRFIEEKLHLVRDLAPVVEGWVLMIDIRRILGDRRRRFPSKIKDFDRVNIGEDHERTNLVKIPAIINKLKNKGLVEKQKFKYKDKRNRESELYAYRIAKTEEAWVNLALIYDQIRAFPHFYVSHYARNTLKTVMKLLQNFSKLIDSVEGAALWEKVEKGEIHDELIKDGYEMRVVNRPLFLPRLFTLFLRDQKTCEEELTRIRDLRGIKGVTEWDIDALIHIGEYYYGEDYPSAASRIEMERYYAIVNFIGKLRKEKVLDATQINKIEGYLHSQDFFGPFHRISKNNLEKNRFRGVITEIQQATKQKVIREQKKKRGGDR